MHENSALGYLSKRWVSAHYETIYKLLEDEGWNEIPSIDELCRDELWQHVVGWTMIRYLSLMEEGNVQISLKSKKPIIVLLMRRVQRIMWEHDVVRNRPRV